MTLFRKLIPGALAVGLLLPSAPCRADTTVTVQVSIAGVALGGVAWALSVVWSDRVGLLAKSLASPPPVETTPEPLVRNDLKVFFPLLVIPLN